ncbi:restriction endonuclease [Microbacterium paludicola]|uniref:restriction endonuclease n=1 Tax=Microbacterium paludicola TaxID=300019 RepID=UPI0009042D0D|nr:restriction endonuclease [Microbacterium paludicola]APF32955.1 restriction endonuclease [Microbacterium paludicola]
MNVWGIHNDSLTTELVEEGFISIGWDDQPDLRGIRDGRQGLKRALAEQHPDAKPGSIAARAGVLVRFRDEMNVGDVVVAPYKPDSTINLGVISSDYYFEPDAPTHRHRRRVEWGKIGLPRTVFTQPALFEIGSVLTVFRVRRHVDEFLTALRSDDDSIDGLTRAVDEAADRSSEDDAASDEPRASRIDRHTRDFVLETLHRRLSHQEFEEFTAELLRALGYQARVTQYSQDGGVDVIAHRDPLGVEPPQIKVQCKHHTGTISAPEVQQLAGAQGPGELSIFVTLGTYTKDARSIERQRTGLRLLSGEDVVGLVLENYDKLPEKRRALIPLTRVLVVSDSADL